MWQVTELRLEPKTNGSSFSFLSLYLRTRLDPGILGPWIDFFFSYLSFPNESFCFIAILRNWTIFVVIVRVNYVLKEIIEKFSHSQVKSSMMLFDHTREEYCDFCYVTSDVWPY